MGGVVAPKGLASDEGGGPAVPRRGGLIGIWQRRRAWLFLC